MTKNDVTEAKTLEEQRILDQVSEFIKKDKGEKISEVEKAVYPKKNEKVNSLTNYQNKVKEANDLIAIQDLKKNPGVKEPWTDSINTYYEKLLRCSGADVADVGDNLKDSIKKYLTDVNGVEQATILNAYPHLWGEYLAHSAQDDGLLFDLPLQDILNLIKDGLIKELSSQDTLKFSMMILIDLVFNYKNSVFREPFNKLNAEKFKIAWSIFPLKQKHQLNRVTNVLNAIQVLMRLGK